MNERNEQNLSPVNVNFLELARFSTMFGAGARVFQRHVWHPDEGWVTAESWVPNNQ